MGEQKKWLVCFSAFRSELSVTLEITWRNGVGLCRGATPLLSSHALITYVGNFNLTEVTHRFF